MIFMNIFQLLRYVCVIDSFIKETVLQTTVCVFHFGIKIIVCDTVILMNVSSSFKEETLLTC